MKLGRNAPCHCGSGKKYKTCCLRKDEEASHALVVTLPEPVMPAAPAPPVVQPPARPEVPLDPRIAAINVRWEEFSACDYEGRLALFQQTLTEPELMDGEMAFAMLDKLFVATSQQNERQRFDALVESLRAQLPEVYDEEAHYCLDWQISNALVSGQHNRVPELVNEMADLADTDLDIWNRVESQLAYHGQLTVLVHAMRRAWPLVRQSSDVVYWGIDEFAQRAINYELLHYAAHTPTVRADGPELLARLTVYSEELLPERLTAYLSHLTGQAQRQWHMDDFKFATPPRPSRRDWDEVEEDEAEAAFAASQSPATQNVHDLSIAFLGYLHGVEGVPYTRGDLGRRELVKFLLQRRDEKLEYRESMLESMERDRARRRGRKVKAVRKFAAYPHLLVPDHERLDRYLGGVLGFLNQLYYEAAALFEILPAWLRFLEAQQLMDAALRVQALRDIESLVEPLAKVCGNFVDDPAPQQALLRWNEYTV